MEQADNKQRSFVNRYWIVIVIVLWLIAWSARDVLAPSTDAVAETDSVSMEETAGAAPREGRLSEGDMDPMTGEAYEREDEAGTHRPIPDPQEQARARATGEPMSEEDVARQVQDALEAGRAAYWREGPEDAAKVLRNALADIPATAAQRADLYGELGNALHASGDVPSAMQAWDSALRLLPSAERQTMIDRLAPVYDRHHSDGARHLRQYR